jgi:hypothetical protein
MDHEGVDFILVRTHQDGTAISASVFDRSSRRFQHWRRVGHRSNDKRRRNDREGLLRQSGHCLQPSSKCGRNVHSFRQLPSLIPAEMRSIQLTLQTVSR